MDTDTGIELPDHKLPLVQSRVIRRLKALGLSDFRSYCDLVESPEGTAERLEMLSVLTTNVTEFFREPHHFDYLCKHRIPVLCDHLRSGSTVRVWSAGCSTGEEAYSLMLAFLGEIPDIADYDFKILATDIDPVVLKTAVRGLYSDSGIARVPERLRKLYFEPSGDQIEHNQIFQSAKDIVVFRRLNLIDDWPLTRKFDVIMCRNVVIYFGDATKVKVWKRLAQHLQPDGLLFTGHSERLNGPAAELLQLVATTTYQPNTGNTTPEGNDKCL